MHGLFGRLTGSALKACKLPHNKIIIDITVIAIDRSCADVNSQYVSRVSLAGSKPNF